MHNSFIITDDFYPDPMAIRDAALGGEFWESERYVGLDCDQKLIHTELDATVSRLVGQKVKGNMAEMGNHGRFRVTLASHVNNDYMAGIHVDSNDCEWAGLVCLTLPQDLPTDLATGTHFYRHKQYDIDRLPLNPDEEKAFGVGYWEMRKQVDIDGNDYDKWRFEFQLPLRFNRLLLFRPWYFHDNGANFGDKIENGRLVHLMFFVVDND